jgi:hypothetical protein
VIVLNERERRMLARMERHLTDTDPGFVRMFARLGRGVRTAGRPRSMHAAGTMPCLLLVAGLVLMVLGGMTAAPPVAVSGLAIAVLSLFIAHTSPAGPDPHFA